VYGDWKFSDGPKIPPPEMNFPVYGNGVPPTNAVYGLPYTAPYKSTKLTSNDPREGSGLTQKSRMDHMSLIMYNTHYQGVKYGTDLNHLDILPLVEDGAITPADTIWPEYDHDAFEVNDIWSSDTRVCLQAQSPLPCTILGTFVTSATNVKA